MLTFIGFLIYSKLAYKYRNHVFTSLLFVLYALSFGASSILSIYSNKNVTFSSFIYLILILPFYFIGFRNIRYNTISFNSRINIKKIAIGFVIFLIPAFIFYGYFATQTILFVDISRARIDGINLIPKNFINTVLSSVTTFFYIPLLMFFIFYTEKIYPKLRNVLLITSLSYVFLTLCYSGRDGVVYWILNVLLLFLLFSHKINNKERIKIKRILIFIVLGFSIVFMIISFARFRDSEKGVWYSLVSYLGQQSSNFSVFFDIDKFLGHSTIFPGWEKILGLSSRENFTEFDYIKWGLDGYYGVFSFFICTPVQGYGKILTIFISLFYFIIVKHFVVLYIKQKNIYDLLIFYTLFQIPLQGVFYYRQGIGNEDVLYTILILFLIILKKINR